MIIRLHFFNLAILFFVALVFVLIVFILISIYIRTKRGKKLQKWKLMADLLVRKAIFHEEAEDGTINSIPVTTRTTSLLNDAHFRAVLTDALVNAKKNVTGSSADNLKQLYLQLGLQQYALNRLKSYKWYIKAQAIQQLAIMDLKENLTKIYRFTNNANDLVRMEAQLAVVKFYGFEGLRFLDVVSYPITEWQQIKLLNELSHMPPEHFSGIEKWLQSDNKSVVAFALKIARTYHRFELYDNVAACLSGSDDTVRLQAIITLGELFNDETSALLIGRYFKEAIKHQMAIIKILQNIATDDDIPILMSELATPNAELKLMLARALANTGPNGIEALRNHAEAQHYPLDQIITQIESEVTA
jgi:hypothetical protein